MREGIAKGPGFAAPIRIDEPDRLFTYQESKERAIVEEVVDNHARSRPVLIGTSSVAESESLAERLAERGITAAVLNAKDDTHEAEIIAGAGAPGAVTVSTQMAGRGTDIRLSDDEVAEAGGLLVIGAGRYPSSRLDDQLRGRAGRQGDPGTSVFFTSLEDELLTRVPEIQRFVTEGDEIVFKADVGSLAPGVAQIQGVWVAPSHRGRGLAAPCMAAVVDLVEQTHADTVSLYVNDYNLPALRAYLSAGFERVGTFATVIL